MRPFAASALRPTDRGTRSGSTAPRARSAGASAREPTSSSSSAPASSPVRAGGRMAADGVCRHARRALQRDRPGSRAVQLRTRQPALAADDARGLPVGGREGTGGRARRGRLADGPGEGGRASVHLSAAEHGEPGDGADHVRRALRRRRRAEPSREDGLEHACSCAETRGYEGIHGLGTARSRISAVWPTNGSSSATSATAERRDGIRPVVLAMRARASVATARSSSRIATSGCAAWRNTV